MLSDRSVCAPHSACTCRPDHRRVLLPLPTDHCSLRPLFPVRIGSHVSLHAARLLVVRCRASRHTTNDERPSIAATPRPASCRRRCCCLQLHSHPRSERRRRATDPPFGLPRAAAGTLPLSLLQRRWCRDRLASVLRAQSHNRTAALSHPPASTTGLPAGGMEAQERYGRGTESRGD